MIRETFEIRSLRSSGVRGIGHFPVRSRHGFSLIEILVSVAVLAILVVLLASAIGHISSAWRWTRGKAESFQEARAAFETISRRLSQATLNTYWDYDDINNPVNYKRASDLRFASGPTDELVGGSGRPTHGVFFVANEGIVSNSANRALYDALNAFGYYLEFGSDKDFRPPFVNSPERYRFRLMEMAQPAESVSIYTTNPKQPDTSWFRTAVTSPAAQQPTRVVAENIIALVILPMLSEKDDPTGVALSPTYRYRSDEASYANSAGASNPVLNTAHQLPPVIRVAMVAIDEASARRLENGATAPDFQLSSLFQNAASFARDLYADPAVGGSSSSIEQRLIDQGLNYRIFVADIPIAAARWSREQTQ